MPFLIKRRKLRFFSRAPEPCGIGGTQAAPAPFLLGWLHDTMGGWDTPLALLVVVAVGLLVCGLAAGRPGLVGDP